MTVLTRNPTNKDLLQSTKFRLNFGAIPGVTYFCQSANLPGASVNEIPRYTPFVDLYSPGEKIIYDTLNITFLLDEDIRAWEQLHDWIRAMTFPTDFKEYANLSKLNSVSGYRSAVNLKPQLSDGSLTIFTNKNNPNIRINFKDLFPTTLGSVLFNAADTADNIQVADATFRFSYYNIERV